MQLRFYAYKVAALPLIGKTLAVPDPISEQFGIAAIIGEKRKEPTALYPLSLVDLRVPGDFGPWQDFMAGDIERDDLLSAVEAHIQERHREKWFISDHVHIRSAPAGAPLPPTAGLGKPATLAPHLITQMIRAVDVLEVAPDADLQAMAEMLEEHGRHVSLETLMKSKYVARRVGPRAEIFPVLGGPDDFYDQVRDMMREGFRPLRTYHARSKASETDLEALHVSARGIVKELQRLLDICEGTLPDMGSYHVPSALAILMNRLQVSLDARPVLIELREKGLVPAAQAIAIVSNEKIAEPPRSRPGMDVYKTSP